MLLGKVDRQTVALINKQFECLDLDGGGTITIDELDPAAQEQARMTRKLNSIVGTAKAVQAFSALRKPPSASIDAQPAATTSFGSKTFRENLAEGFKAAQAEVAAAAASASASTAEAEADLGVRAEPTRPTAETEFDGFEGIAFENNTLPEFTVDANGQAGLVF